MKKTFARFLTLALVLAMLVCCMGGLTVSAAESEEEYTLFIAYGGDKEAENDWLYEYYGADTEKSAGITATTATVKSGDTATISLTFDNANFNSWFFAPCLVAEDVSSIVAIDFDITCKIDGQDVAIDMAADADGKTWWTEGTGEYSATQCIRLAGGYNEWGTKYIAEPAGFTTIEYTITLNSVELGDPNAPAVTVTESTEEYGLFIAYGGDKAAENDWLWSYDNSAEVEGITAVTATAKSGDTVTISLTFDTPTVNSWYFAPCLVGEDITNVYDIDFTVTCMIDGVEVPVNMEADADGKTWWTEGTGSYTAEQCIRLAGGYNEWGAHYIDEPAGFTTIEYTITFNSIKLGTVEEVEPVEIPIDLDGTYNAYLMLQTPNWTFRDAHDSANGIGSDVWGQHITNNDSGTNYGVVTDAVVAGNGTYTVSITDFGTVFADDFTAAGQEYFNIIGISTDIPKSDKVQITDVKLLVDGQVRHTYDTAVLNPDTTDTMQILIQNIWNSDVAEISYYPAPAESLEIQFTVSGFNYDNAEQAVDETEPVTEATEPVTEATEPETTEPAPEEKGNVGTTVATVIIIVAIVAAVVVVVVLQKKKNA